MSIPPPAPVSTPSPGDGGGPPEAGHFKFKRVNEITGTLVLAVVAALVAAVIWTGRSQRWFRSTVPVRIVLPETGAAGIRQGSEVYFLGTLVGSVADVVLDAEGRMQAEARLRRDFFRFVRVDSSAVVKKKFGVAGDSFFEITRGEGGPLPEPDASIVCNEQFQSALEAAVEQVRAEALLVLGKFRGGLDAWTRLGTNLDAATPHLNRTAVHLESLAADLALGKGTAGRLLTDTALADEAGRLLQQANALVDGLRGAVTNLNAAAQHVQAGAARLPEITGAVADGAKDLPALVQQTQTSMREFERLIEAAQRHWLVRKHINPTNPPPSRPLPTTAEPRVKPVKTLRSPRGSTP